MACVALPDFSFSAACAPDAKSSEIEEIYVANADADTLADWTVVGTWTALLDQSATASGNEIRRWDVIGDKPAATAVVAALSKKRTKKIDATHVINFEIDDVSDENYAAATELQVGANVKIWYKTRGGHLYGGNDGIVAAIDINPVLGRGDEIEKLVGTLSWNSKTDPERVVSPI